MWLVDWWHRITKQPQSPYVREDLEVLSRYDSGDTASGDRAVLDQLRGRGSDLSLPRHTIHFLYFPTRGAAQEAAEILRAGGHIANTRPRNPAASANSWPVLVETVAVVDEATIASGRETFESLATRFGGEYDGWEAALD